MHPDSDSFPRKHPLIASGLVLAAIIGTGFLASLPGALYLLSFSVCLPLAIAQSWLNSYWRSQECPPRPIRYAFTVKELAAIIVGSLLLGLVLAGFFIVPPEFRRTH